MDISSIPMVIKYVFDNIDDGGLSQALHDAQIKFGFSDETFDEMHVFISKIFELSIKNNHNI